MIEPVDIPGFTHLAEELFGSGRDVAMVHVYRHDLFAELLKVDDRDSRTEFVLLPEATYLQGAADADIQRLEHHAPQHDSPLGKYEVPGREVTVGPFLIARTPVTQEIWDAVADHFELELFDERNLEGPFIPVHGVNPGMFEPFLGATGLRLPTEAEWEWAARGGSENTFVHGNDPGGLRDYAWFGHVGEAGPMSVAQRKPNLFGLFDIVGNVWEWCADSWADSYGEMSAGDVYRDESSVLQVIRGGSFRVDSLTYLAPAYRSYSGIYATAIDVGLRLAYSP